MNRNVDHSRSTGSLSSTITRTSGSRSCIARATGAPAWKYCGLASSRCRSFPQRAKCAAYPSAGGSTPSPSVSAVKYLISLTSLGQTSGCWERYQNSDVVPALPTPAITTVGRVLIVPRATGPSLGYP